MVKPQGGELAPINQPASEDSRVLMMIVQKMSEDPDFDIDKVKEMIEIKRGLDADVARKAFNLAVAEFKRNPPVVVRDMLNKQYGSTYASIAAVVNTTNAALAPHGLNASWDVVEQTKEGMRVACILSHSLGHEKRVEIWGPMDASGQKNPLQQVKSTMTYLKIATFEAVTGIASREGNQDDDGNGAGSNLTGDAKQKPDDAIANPLYDKIEISEAVAELQKVKPEIEAAKVGAGTKRNLIAAYNAKLKKLREPQ